MDHVELGVSEAPAQIPRAVCERACSRRELTELYVDVLDRVQRPELVAHEAATRGMRGVRPHVRDQQGAHER
jgi:hypothetical protein